MGMLAHLLNMDPEPLTQAASSFVPLETATASETLNGKINTDDWLEKIGAADPVAIDPALERALAVKAFGAVTGTTPAATEKQKKEDVLALRTPEAIRKVVGMLTAYEWEFIDQAQQIRSYIVKGLIDETTNTRPDIRLKAFKLLGDVTEIGLFTQRTEVVTKNLSDEQVEAEIRRRLERLTINPDTPLITRIDTEVDDGDGVGNKA